MGSEDPDPKDEARTVFIPAGAATTPPPPPTEPAEPSAPPEAAEPIAVAAASAPSAPAIAPTPSVVRAGRVEVGSVLNNIYEIRRFIARGGMGEVFEGVNVNDEHDRVAIKVMLPSLAADPNVQAMFRKEARTLTRLSHPAVVQYRVLAMEPQLGVFYIVTEFIDGRSLADQLGELKADGAQLKSLIRRLAEGLRAAHELGAVHRDMAPDNVLLPEGRIDRAKIIDFGIAKDLDPSKATIVGDGFAGKLGYVAPEQFGDFGREVGPWTDVYSLGLVILSVASGHHVDMGATLVDAVDKRRAGPDLSAAPPEIRHVLAQMLVANPANRLRSMDEVLAALDAPPPAVAAPEARTQFMPAGALAASMTSSAGAATAPPRSSASQAAGAAPATAQPATVAQALVWAKGPGRLPLMVGGGVVGVLLAGGLIMMALGSHPASRSAPPAVAAASAAAPGETVRRAIAAVLPTVGCSWLDIASVTEDAGGVIVRMKGVAGEVVKAQAAVEQAARAAGAPIKDIGFDVSPLKDRHICSRLDAFNTIRADPAQGVRLTTAQTAYELRTAPDNPVPTAHPVVTVSPGDPSLGFVVAGLDSNGALAPVVTREQLPDFLRSAPQNVAKIGADSYRLGGDVTGAQDWFGTLLLTGKGPFDPNLLTLKGGEGGADWAGRFKTAAAAGGWKAEMVWYKVVKAGS